MALPTILLVPGALTTNACYDLILPHLEQAGFPVTVASLASSNPSNPEQHSAASDGTLVLERYLLPLIDAGKDVVVFAHSFGATSLSGAFTGLSKIERQDHAAGGVLGLVYISFAMVPAGQSQFEYLGGAWPDFVKRDHVSISEVWLKQSEANRYAQPAPGLFVFDPVIDTLFNDADPDLQGQFAAGHTPHSINPFVTPVHAPLWTDPHFNGRRVLIKTMACSIIDSAKQLMLTHYSMMRLFLLQLSKCSRTIAAPSGRSWNFLMPDTRLFLQGRWKLRKLCLMLLTAGHDVCNANYLPEHILTVQITSTRLQCPTVKS